ncbi:Transcription initiation factor IIB [Seminavis robusta]|uniref:General transcription factor TFIIB n=1 Tax=Seminavis robusta TaxID=568900 RepID=A0A9N8DFN7_9STRA|nr:Transcription initiation factor IIB [Seminavis robusta]|eukprot:Sro96_g049630.1 Transcription initiation factor IIB (801) ;mRNA; f:73292-76154
MSTTTSAGGVAPVGSKPNYIWDLEGPEIDLWLRSVKSLYPGPSVEPSPEDLAKRQFIPLLWKNLEHALGDMKAEAVRSSDSNSNSNSHHGPDNTTSSSAGGPPAKKRAKKDRLLGYKLHDPCKIWIHIKEFESMDDNNNNNKDPDGKKNNQKMILLPEAVPTVMGAKLAELSVAGIINGFASVNGGFVDKHLKPVGATEIELSSVGKCTVVQLKSWAVTLHQSVQNRLEKDVLDTTPQRIASMMCPDLSLSEFKAVRRRIYDTVILGKGLKVEEVQDIPVATTSQSVHDIEKFKKCKVCGNNDQSSFILDRKNGDVICSNCGTVVAESVMHEGSQFRKFEGEVDRNHHGDAANPLLSTSYNMSTTLGGVQVTSGAGLGGFGSNQNKRGLETILRNAHAFTELNVSSLGNSKDAQGRTRVGYKDKQKKQAFVQMNHVGDALNLHEAVVQRAKEIFAGFRDDRELLHQLKAVIAACLCESFDQLSQDGRKILQQQETGTVEAEEISEKEKAAASVANAKKAAIAKSISTNRRAVKRANLHNASMAGKGGLFLDFSDVEEKTKIKTEDGAGAATPASTSPTTNSRFELKSASTWDLEDCRSWLLDASRSIAQTWVDERDGLTADNQSTNGSKAGGPAAKRRYPKGSRDELEGKLVEDAITLVEFLESQLKKNETKGGAGGKRVITPRVTDMSKLGIRWQHAHERGSGGKGGVGNSGNMKKRANATALKSRKAGQILILQAAKKLGEILKDPLAGEYFHKELRALVGRQKARKDKDLRDEASRQRLIQMKRKPWLQAKVTGDVS